MLAQTLAHSEWVPHVIAALTLLGFTLQLVSYVRYSSEITYTDRLKDRITDLLSSEAKTLIPAVELLESEQIPSEAMVATRTRELERFSQYPGMVALHDLGAVAAEGDAGRLKNAIPNVMIASLLVCGLFGTLLSLSETLQDPALAKFISKEGNASSSAFQESLGTVIAGFGKAFNASIYGVGGTLWLILARVFVRAKRETCLEKLENFVVECLLPYYIEPEKTQLQRATSSVTESNKRFKSVSNQMEKSSEVVNDAVESLERAIKQASITFGEEGAVAYQLVRFTEQAEVLNESIKTTGESNTRVSEMLGALGADHRDLIEKFDQRIESSESKRLELMKQLPQFIKSITEENQRIKEDFGYSVKELIESQKKSAGLLKEEVDRQHKHLERLVTDIGAVQRQFLDKLHTDYLDATKEANEASKSLLAESGKVSGNMVMTLQVLKDQLEKLVLREDRVDIDAFNQFRAHLNEIQSSLRKVVESNNQAIDKSYETQRKLDEKMMKTFGEFSSKVGTLAKVIDKIADAGAIERETITEKIMNIFRR